jgi:hypothetical protein
LGTKQATTRGVFYQLENWFREVPGELAVGNGRKVKIWKDNWLLGQSNPKSCCPENTLFGEATVSELIDEDSPGS